MCISRCLYSFLMTNWPECDAKLTTIQSYPANRGYHEYDVEEETTAFC